MQDRKVNYAALKVANLGSMSGRGAADEVNLGSRTDLRMILGQIARYGIVGAAIAPAAICSNKRWPRRFFLPASSRCPRSHRTVT